MKEDYHGAIVITLLALLLAVCVWAWGYVEGLEDPYVEAIFENCKELKIDTLSYSYENDSYVLKITKVR